MNSNKNQVMGAYEAPQVYVIEVNVEQGFAATGTASDIYIQG